MQSTVETVNKMVLMALVVLAALAVWLLPKTRLGRAGRISERLFVATCALGVVCGGAGIVTTFLWPRQVLEWHLWEAIVMPLALLYAYWFVVARAARGEDILDEKQNLDMANGAGTALGVSILAMAVASILVEKGLFDPALWYPYYLFVTLLAFSGGTLYFFKRG